MTTTEHLTRTKVRREPEKRRREIHIHIVRPGPNGDPCALQFPLSELDAATIAELRVALPDDRVSFTPAHYARDVATGAQICERHGWRLDDVWRDERGELHVRMSKEDA